MKWRLMAVLALSLVVTGCATTEMETARQLDSGETVIAGTATVPGALGIIPRASGSVRYGHSVGDVGGHIGTTLATYSAGLGTRLYPTDFLTFSLQGDFKAPIISADDFIGATQVTLTPRISTSAEGNRFVYGGLEASVPLWISGDGGFIGGDAAAAQGGFFVGVDVLTDEDEERDFGVQAEMGISPLAVRADGVVQETTMDMTANQYGTVFRFSIGMYGRYPGDLGGDDDEESLEPTPDDETDSDSDPVYY